MNLIGIKNTNDRSKRGMMYSKLEKMGFTHKPHPSNDGGYLIVSPNKEFYNVHRNTFDTFMFPEHFMYEAKNEKEFFELINKFYNNGNDI